MATAKTILLVEDDPWHSSVAIDFLNQEGYYVLHAASGEEALRLAREEHPDLILLDFALPDQSGLTMLRYLQHSWQTRDIPVIMVTAFANPFRTLVEASSIDQLKQIIEKPYDVEYLLACVQAAFKPSKDP